MMPPTLRRGKAGGSGRGTCRDSTRESAAMIAGIAWTPFTVPPRPPVWARPPAGWVGLWTVPGGTRTTGSAAERLGHRRGAGAQAALHQVVRALPALRLAGDTGDDEIAGEADAGAPDRLRRHDDAREPALHVLHAVAVEAVALERGRPGIAPPA